MFAEALCLNYGSKLEICFGKSNTNEHKVSLILYGHTPHHLKGEILITDATSTPTSHPIHSERISTSREASYRGAQIQPILVSGLTYIETVAASPTLYIRVLRYRAPSSPICLSEEIHKPFALSRVFILSSGGKSILLAKKKAPSGSAFPLSTHVVLKTRHVNPKIHVRRYYSHVRSPNLSTTRP